MNQFHISQVQWLFDAEYPTMGSFKAFLQLSLEMYQLDKVYEPERIIEIACSSSDDLLTSDSIIKIHLSWLKTTCLETIEFLSNQRENRRKFDIAIQALFDMANPDTQSLWANTKRTLYQFRLNGTYEVREIFAEAYSRGVKQIESGKAIEKPLAWMRTACLNVIREFRCKQNKLDRPKLDSEGLHHGDEVLSHLMIAEDRKAVLIALERLAPEDQQVLCARIFQGLSWQAIGESLIYTESCRVSANTVRQRGFRALKKLREHYKAIRQEVETIGDGIE
jgi:RNA polymerase sigma factor (sigma-70 family)